MDIHIEIRKIVSENTLKYGIGKLEEIGTPKIQEQLIQIEEFLQRFYLQQTEIAENVKQFSKLSISSVALGANVPRSQINLNTHTLKNYIEERIVEIEKEDILNWKKFEQYRAEKRGLDSYIDGLRQQVVDSYESKYKIEELEKENKRLILQLEMRQQDIYKLQVENSNLKKKLNEQSKKNIVRIDYEKNHN